jgi:hypothetical protein
MGEDRPTNIPLEPAQLHVSELEMRIAEQAAFTRLLKLNGEASLARVGQDLLKDLQRSLRAARKAVGQSPDSLQRARIGQAGEPRHEASPDHHEAAGQRNSSTLSH